MDPDSFCSMCLRASLDEGPPCQIHPENQFGVLDDEQTNRLQDHAKKVLG